MTTGPGGQTPPRVRVTSPHASAARARDVSIASEIDAETSLGEVYVSSLMRSQLRLALGVLGVLALTVGTLPILFHLFPELRRLEVLGLPVPWLVLGVVVFVEILLLGWYYVRQAERNEDDFSYLLDSR